MSQFSSVEIQSLHDIHDMEMSMCSLPKNQDELEFQHLADRTSNGRKLARTIASLSGKKHLTSEIQLVELERVDVMEELQHLEDILYKKEFQYFTESKESTDDGFGYWSVKVHVNY